MFGFQQCCDAGGYIELGRLCSSNLDYCWNTLRPVGAILLSAVMPYGLAPFNHFLLLIFSLFLIASELGFKLNRKCFNLLIFKAGGAFFLLELMFMGLASVDLTDIPAGIFAAFAIIGFARKNVLLLALAGGGSVLIRAAYLYPMMILVIYFLVECLYGKQYWKSLLAGLFFVCIAPQFLLTYQHTNAFSFLDPTVTAFWKNLHLSTSWYGYDTILSPDRGFSWASPPLPDLITAYKQKQWGDIVHLLVGRMEYYFSSFVPWSKVYLSSPSERIFSPLIFALHFAMFVLSSLYLMQREILWRVGFPLCLILAQSLLIIPEQRFVFIIQLFLVMFTYLYFLGLGDLYFSAHNKKFKELKNFRKPLIFSNLKIIKLIINQ